MLNFEAKEFGELVATMSRVLSVTAGAGADKNADLAASRPATTGPGAAEKSQSNIMTNKDRKVNEDFIQKSMQAVGQSLIRYLNALLAQGNGLNTTATVSQLHNLSSFEGATDIGPLLRIQRDMLSGGE